MEKFLKDFEVEYKKPSEEAIRRWRSAVALVKNPRRRFRFVADLAKRSEAEKKKLQIQEKIRVALYVQKAALQFIDAGDRGSIEKPGHDELQLPEDARMAGFSIHPDELASITRAHDIKALESHGGIHGILRKVNVSVDEGVKDSNIPIRQNVYGLNRYKEKPPRTFWVFVWEALQDLTLMILMVCAVVSIGVGIATEGWPKGTYNGLGILISIILMVMVTAISDYKRSLQFKDLDREKKKIFVQVTRDGKRQKVSIYDLVVGDIVHLLIGDQVPADGLFISGYSLLIDESSLSGESEPVNVSEGKPFLLSGTKVQDGSCKMLVTTVGMKTEWGKLMETLSEGGEDETPLQVKLNGVATIIGKIGLTFAVLTFLVLTVRFLETKGPNNEITDWSSADAVTLLSYFAIAVTIIVVAVPEGLPLAVTLSLAFAMKKWMNDRALVRHLSACETMGSASCICTDKTGTLTTNHMVVTKVWMCEKSVDVKENDSKETLISEISRASSILLQVIFQNTSSEVIKDDGKISILGTPTESALLEFGLLLGGDFDTLRREVKILKIRPFNSVRKKMSVLVAYPHGGTRAFCKGASEIVLGICNKYIDSNGESVHLSREMVKNITDVINSFACEALRTLCLAFKDIDDSSIENGIPDDGYTLVAVVGINDPVRPGVREAVQTCLAAGITGDNINTAKAIAKECGILTEGCIAIEGSMSLEQMKTVIPKIQVMTRSLPLDKHTLVKILRDEFGEVVAVTGDGTNDAPALHESDIGLAMGIAGIEVAKENADDIISDDNFKTIVNVARWGRSVYINIQKFVQFQLTVNVVALIINVVSACVLGYAPLTAVQLLWVNLIMDTLGALALATESPNDGLMKRPLVARGTNFITKAVWRNIIGQSIYQLAVLGVLNFSGEKLLGLTGSDATEVLNTVIFNAFVFCQVFNQINSRDIVKISVFHGMFDSWVFRIVMVCTATFQWDPKTHRPARRELSPVEQRAVPRTPRESFPEASMQTKASKAGKSWSSKGAVPRAPSESSPDTNMQIDISSDSNGTTCAVVRYVCKDQFGHDICSVSAGSVKTIGRLWKRVLECELSPRTVSEVVDLVQKTLMTVYSLKDFKSGETCSIIIAGGRRQEIFHVGGRLANMPHYISCAYHVIGSGSRLVNAALEVLYSGQHDEGTLVRTVEKSYLFASLHDQSTGGFIKFYNVHGEIHQHLFTKHTLELYRDIYANHIKSDEVAVLIFSKDFDKKRIHKCFHKETVLRHAHVLGYVRGYQVNRVVLKRTDYENHLCTVRFVKEKLLSSGYVPECKDPVIKDFNLSFYKLSQKHRKGLYYFTEVSRDILKDLVPQGMVEGLIGRNAYHPGREQSLENVERRLVVKTGPKESPGLEDVLNEFHGEEPMPEEVPGDVYDELEINQLEVPARAVDLYRHFRDVSDVGDGDVTEVKVCNHEDKHYGYLEFRTRDAALSAMEKVLKNPHTRPCSLM
ncbi:hypothetical protein ACFX2H_008987 [Malus domestica]